MRLFRYLYWKWRVWNDVRHIRKVVRRFKES